MSSNRSSSSEFMAEVRCRCGDLAPMKMSWSYANQGKRYRACPRYGGNGSCRYFEWMDYDVSERVSNVLRGLLKKADKHEKEIEKLQFTIEKKDHELKMKILESNLKFLYGFGIGMIFAGFVISVWMRSGSVNVTLLPYSCNGMCTWDATKVPSPATTLPSTQIYFERLEVFIINLNSWAHLGMIRAHSVPILLHPSHQVQSYLLTHCLNWLILKT
nr:uncharacterized protein LOC109164785 [Ipomoea batatas]